MSMCCKIVEGKRKRDARTGESGNVLFLILIAVVLFAALSYAVTQSSRSGAGSAANETNSLNAAQITQYPASVRTATIRMMVNGTDVTELEFNPPATFGSLTSTAVGVFHPSGGGATYVSAPADVMANNLPGTWYFNANFDIVEVGTTGVNGNDLIAFLPGIKSAVCTRINEELGITGDVTDDFTDASYTANMDNAYTFPTTDQEDIGDAQATGLAKQPFGCMIDSSNSSNIYFHVLSER